MTKTKVLVVCMMGRDRSQKAKQILNEEYENFEAKCAGVHPVADLPLTKESLDWADKIIFMEENHKSIFLQRFPEYKEKEISVWNIPPIYSFDEPELELRIKDNINKELI